MSFGYPNEHRLFQVSVSWVYYQNNLGQKKIISVGKSVIKIHKSPKFLSIIPTIQKFILNMFHCHKNDETGDDDKTDEL